MKQVKGVNFRELDKNIKNYWKENNTYEKVKSLNEYGPDYYFVDGPPYCSGAIHLGTAWNKIIKDTVLRFKRIQGYNVLDKAGWDMHGLPIEVKVENEFNIGSKKDIETKIGTQVFIDKCKEFALNHLSNMEKQFKNLGIWLDFENAYMPIKNDYIEMGWWTLKKAHEKDLLTKDLRSGYWCPRCETSLAEHEVRGEYKEVLDPSVYVKFKLKDSNEFITIWTTTPWTLPSNMLVCINPEFDYAYVNVEFNGKNETWIIAEKLVPEVMKKGEKQNPDLKFHISKTVKGESLIGLKYIHPFLEENEKQGEFSLLKNAHSIVPGNHVTLEGGTGLVHTAPGFGEDDFNVGKEYGILAYAPIDDNGRYIESIWKGLFVKEMDKPVIERLIEKNLLINSGKVKHTYPHCWRCKTPLLFRATEQWFLSISKIKEGIIEQGKTVDWVPDWVKTRYVNGVSFVGDWNISRQRYWGIPIPIWTCDCCKKYEVIGAISELIDKANEKDVDLSDLHKPTVDKITLKCSCGGIMTRTPDVLDVWYDSGLAPYASIGSKELKKAEFITEGNDQVTKWFYSQHALSAVVFNDTPYKKCMMHGFTLDETGEKMSKSLGNIVSPDEVTEKYGADVLRFYLLSANKAWEDLRFSYSEMDEVRSALNTLWNSYAFSTNYMVLDEFIPNNEYFKHLKDEDAWILSRVNTVSKDAIEALEKPHLHTYTWMIRDFILNDLSRWYIKLIRDRTWMEKNDVQKLSAYQTLYYVIMKLIMIMSPVTPHISEEIYQNLKTENMPESVFMNKLTVETEFINSKLEEDIEIVREVVDSILKGRDKVKYTLRYPITKITLPENIKETVEKYEYLIKEQGNVKNIELKEFEGNVTVKPNFKELGKIFRSNVPKVVSAINSVNPKELKENLKSGEIDILGFTIKPEYVEFKVDIPENIVGIEFSKGNVYMNIDMNCEVIMDGLKREVIRRIQSMRKDMDLDINDRINIRLEGIEFSEESIFHIANEVRGNFVKNLKSEYSQNWNIKTPNEENYDISIEIEKIK
ncbi:isoleucyl-tRNA synthetase [Methanococcus vannielii SB]|uniref:Isoleucine--tRNA ligase n=1 Tax=Methanococcus vannielii (strain ATCC 35089 / DSM 1224 / JCM 13029 / OCM 148 / SB) TaxID=406327 RepID=A6UQB8_METVS|nr:isoleucine--tRNA ligase [Methanococcus vannielii]ABR54690.1 isoleucyl-tRNA synthetase [Methanococcus vannielii SB]